MKGIRNDRFASGLAQKDPRAWLASLARVHCARAQEFKTAMNCAGTLSPKRASNSKDHSQGLQGYSTFKDIKPTLTLRGPRGHAMNSPNMFKLNSTNIDPT